MEGFPYLVTGAVILLVGIIFGFAMGSGSINKKEKSDARQTD